MQYEELAFGHLVTIIPAFLIGTFLLIRRKGSVVHKLLGKIYMVLVFFSAFVTLFMPAEIGPTLLGHFGFIHILTFVALFSVVEAWLAIKRGDVKRHRNSMIALYVGGMLIAGSFTFMPGRMMHNWVFSLI